MTVRRSRTRRAKLTGTPIPFDGGKPSGLDREGSRLGMLEFGETRYTCRDWS